jgi:hypothetical protein
MVRWLVVPVAGAMAMLTSAAGVQAAAPPEAGSSVTITKAEEPAVRPLPGQVITVRSAERITQYMGVTATCTATVSAGTPYISGPNAQALIVLSRSAGCTGTVSATSALEREACGTFGCNWTTATSATHSIAPGQQLSAVRSVACGNADPDRWRSKGRFGSGSYIFSSITWLNCGM